MTTFEQQQHFGWPDLLAKISLSELAIKFVGVQTYSLNQPLVSVKWTYGGSSFSSKPARTRHSLFIFASNLEGIEKNDECGCGICVL